MKNKTVTDFGTVLKERRVELELTQTEVARFAGMHRGSIANIETGKTGVTFETLARLVEALR